ncbi:MAG: hypothetical protein AB7I25_07575 [Vicinamibacterales bacterium]
MSVIGTHSLRAAMALAIGCSFVVTSSAQTAAPKPAAPAAGTAKPAATAKPKPAAAAPALNAPGKGTADRYVGTVGTSLAGVSGETITVDLIRWSTDAERDGLVAALAKGDKEFAAALAQSPSLGYIWRSGSGFGSFVRLAAKWKAADGEHVVLVTESDLATWASKPGSAAAPPKYPYAVIELAMTPAAPAGKTSHAGKVIADPAAKTVRLEDFKTAPIALRGVKHIKGGA